MCVCFPYWNCFENIKAGGGGRCCHSHFHTRTHYYVIIVATVFCSFEYILVYTYPYPYPHPQIYNIKCIYLSCNITNIHIHNDNNCNYIGLFMCAKTLHKGFQSSQYMYKATFSAKQLVKITLLNVRRHLHKHTTHNTASTTHFIKLPVCFLSHEVYRTQFLGANYMKWINKK